MTDGSGSTHGEYDVKKMPTVWALTKVSAFFMERRADMAMVIDGKKYANEVRGEIKSRVELLRQKGIVPTLATILVGDDPASVTYVRTKGNACRRLGMESIKVELPQSATTADVLREIDALNKDKHVHGILLQHPVPSHVDEQQCFLAIDVKKDVDGVNPYSFGLMTMGIKSFKSATPLAITSLLKRYEIPVAGKQVVVIGRSPILGKPVAMMLLNEDATVCVCHSKTQNLPEIVRQADIVVAAVGIKKFVQADWIKPGAILIDAGYNAENIGDIDLEHAAEKSAAYTPVPGGVGPVTIAKLLEQTVQAAEMAI